jgi:hypothetical protein
MSSRELERVEVMGWVASGAFETEACGGDAGVELSANEKAVAQVWEKGGGRAQAQPCRSAFEPRQAEETATTSAAVDSEEVFRDGRGEIRADVGICASAAILQRKKLRFALCCSSLLIFEAFAASKSPTSMRTVEQKLLVSYRKEWSGREDLNLRPPGSEPDSRPY